MWIDVLLRTRAWRAPHPANPTYAWVDTHTNCVTAQLDVWGRDYVLYIQVGIRDTTEPI